MKIASRTMSVSCSMFLYSLAFSTVKLNVLLKTKTLHAKVLTGNNIPTEKGHLTLLSPMALSGTEHMISFPPLPKTSELFCSSLQMSRKH